MRRSFRGEHPASGADAALADTLIAAQGISSGYSSVPVLRDVTLEVRPGEVVALLGPNGAGKTTTLLTLAGELPLQAGRVFFRGSATKSRLHTRCRHGLGYITEERSVFMKLTVAENLWMASADKDLAVELFPALAPLMRRKAGLLSGGEQQMLALGRALARKPSILLADELSLGLAPIIVDRLLAAVRVAADQQGLGVLLVEQHVRKVMAHADRVYVMQRGRIVMSGTATEMRGRIKEIEDSYLTQGAADPAI
jgi:branched-chain amino acid transport system ATP-binding protein